MKSFKKMSFVIVSVKAIPLSPLYSLNSLLKKLYWCTLKALFLFLDTSKQIHEHMCLLVTYETL